MNPDYAFAYHWYACFAAAMRRSDEALEAERHAARLEPLSLGALEEYDQGLEAIGRAIECDPGNTVMQAVRGYLLGRSGREQEAREVIRSLRKRSLQRYVPSFNLALVHASVDEVDETFRWLERAYEERSSWLISLHVEPAFDGLRDDPRLEALAARIGL